MARTLKGKPGNLEQAKRRTWAVLCLSFDAIGEARDDESRRKWVLAYSQLLGGYIRLYEVGELEPRLKAMEQALASLEP